MQLATMRHTRTKTPSRSSLNRQISNEKSASKFAPQLELAVIFAEPFKPNQSGTRLNPAATCSERSHQQQLATMRHPGPKTATHSNPNHQISNEKVSLKISTPTRACCPLAETIRANLSIGSPKPKNPIDMFLTCPCAAQTHPIDRFAKKQENLSMGFSSVNVKCIFRASNDLGSPKKQGCQKARKLVDGLLSRFPFRKGLMGPKRTPNAQITKIPPASKSPFFSHPVDRFLQAYRQVFPENSDASSSSPVRNETPQPSHYTQQIRTNLQLATMRRPATQMQLATT